MLMSRQIDDMLFAVQSKKEFDDAVNELKQHIDIEGEDELASHYNGIELDQRREYIAIKVAVYIVKVCENHGWENMNFFLKVEFIGSHLRFYGESHNFKSVDGLKLEEKMGFGYCNLLGELIFACVVCR